MKYKIGDKVRIRKNLVMGNGYGNDYYTRDMDDIAENHDYILTIKEYRCYGTKYEMLEDSSHYWTDEMIEGLVEELSDREKFEKCMRKLSSLSGYDERWKAFNRCVVDNPYDDNYEYNLKIISDYLFGVEKRKMTKAEIEAELGYEIEIVE